MGRYFFWDFPLVDEIVWEELSIQNGDYCQSFTSHWGYWPVIPFGQTSGDHIHSPFIPFIPFHPVAFLFLSPKEFQDFSSDFSNVFFLSGEKKFGDFSASAAMSGLPAGRFSSLQFGRPSLMSMEKLPLGRFNMGIQWYTPLRALFYPHPRYAWRWFSGYY